MISKWLLVLVIIIAVCFDQADLGGGSQKNGLRAWTKVDLINDPKKTKFTIQSEDIGDIQNEGGGSQKNDLRTWTKVDLIDNSKKTESINRSEDIGDIQNEGSSAKKEKHIIFQDYFGLKIKELDKKKKDPKNAYIVKSMMR